MFVCQYKCKCRKVMTNHLFLGVTILDKAIIQHNMLSASKVYNNISFEELAKLVQISPEKVDCQLFLCIFDMSINSFNYFFLYY